MRETALPVLPRPVAARSPPQPSPEWLAAARKARILSWISLVWMGLEGSIAIVAGIVAGSVALIGFGLDSAIEGFASVVIVWRFTGSRLHSHKAEERAQKLVAIQFFILAPYVGYEGPVIRDVLEAYPGRTIITTFDVAESATGHDRAALIDKFGGTGTPGPRLPRPRGAEPAD